MAPRDAAQQEQQEQQEQLLSRESGSAAPQTWHEAFGVSVAALEKVAAQIASSYPREADREADREAESARASAPGAPATVQLDRAAGNAEVGPVAKRQRLADDHEGQGARDAVT